MISEKTRDFLKIIIKNDRDTIIKKFTEYLSDRDYSIILRIINEIRTNNSPELQEIIKQIYLSQGKGRDATDEIYLDNFQISNILKTLNLARSLYSSFLYTCLEAKILSIETLNESDPLLPILVLPYAAETNDVENTKKLLEYTGNVIFTEGGTHNPIHFAIEKSATDVLALYIERNIGLDEEFNGLTPILTSVKYGSIIAMDMLINAGKDIRAASSEGKDALEIAIINKQFDIGLRLVGMGFDPSKQYEEESFIDLLINNRQYDHLIALKRIGIDINIKNESGYSTFKAACETLNYNLIKVFYDPARNDDGTLSANDLAENPNLYNYIFAASLINKDTMMQDFLLDKPSLDINFSNERLAPPIILAAKYSDIDFFTKLVARGADIKKTTEDCITALMIACSSGKTEIVKFLLASGVDINAKDEEGHSAIEYASMSNDLNIALILIEAGADVNTIIRKDNTLLHIAIEKCNIEAIKSLIKLGANINLLDSKGRTPLQIAAEKNDTEIARILLESRDIIINMQNTNEDPIGSDFFSGWSRIFGIDTVKREGKTALHFAVKNKNIELVNLLIEKGAKLDLVDAQKLTPILIAIGNSDFELVKTLVTAGASVNLVTGCKYGPLDYAIIGEKAEIIDFLLEQGSNPNEALIIALARNNKELINKILTYEIDANYVTHKGITLLHAAISSNDIELVRLIVSKGGNLKITNEKFGSLLHLAVSVSSEMVSFLIDEGCPLDIQDEYGNTPLHIAAKEGKNEIINILIDSGANLEIRNSQDFTPLLNTISDDLEDTAILLIQKGANIHATNQLLGNILIAACYRGLEDLVNILLEKNIDVNIQNYEGLTALYAASNTLRVKIVESLLKAGANPNLQGPLGTSLHIAASSEGNDISSLRASLGMAPNPSQIKYATSEVNREKTIKLLLDYHVEINALNRDQQTALTISIKRWHNDTILQLLKAGANTQIPEYPGPMSEAIRIGNIEAIRHFIDNQNPETEFYKGKTNLHLLINNFRFCIIQHQHGRFGSFMDLDRSELISIKDYFGLIERSINTHPEDINKISDLGDSPLSEAISLNYNALVSFLITNGADVNLKLPGGRTHIAQAIRMGRGEIVDILIEAGADLGLGVDEGGTNLLHLAAETGNLTIIPKLLQVFSINSTDNKNNTPLHYAAKSGNSIEVIKEILQHNPRLDLLNNDGNLAIISLLKHQNYISRNPGSEEVISTIIDSIKEFILQHTDVSGYLLALSAFQNSIPLATKLLDIGVDINSGPFPPILGAVEGENLEMLNFLISKGANVNQLCPENHTPLHYATNPEIRAALIAEGAVDDADIITATDNTVPIETELGGETSDEDFDI